MKALEAQPLGYVEDAFEARTKPADIFSILPAQPPGTHVVHPGER